MLFLERTADESHDEEDEKNINAGSKVIKEFDESGSQLIRTTKLDDAQDQDSIISRPRMSLSNDNNLRWRRPY